MCELVERQYYEIGKIKYNLSCRTSYHMMGVPSHTHEIVTLHVIIDMSDASMVHLKETDACTCLLINRDMQGRILCDVLSHRPSQCQEYKNHHIA